ncbi:hypothetical protein [Leifsonia sp. WHRI 6310E]|uniref:hypothetical protein n=1 Tax=Leifsonia sp. WHRI 6310E TaxID=3162562 RepID=UPI0032EBA7EE
MDESSGSRWSTGLAGLSSDQPWQTSSTRASRKHVRSLRRHAGFGGNVPVSTQAQKNAYGDGVSGRQGRLHAYSRHKTPCCSRSPRMWRNGEVLAPVNGHNAVGGSAADDSNHYFGRGTQSLTNIQSIINGTPTLR